MMASSNVAVEAVSPPIKTGWFDSLKRTRKPKHSSSSGLSSAKSLSSLNHHSTVVQSVVVVEGQQPQLDHSSQKKQQEQQQTRSWRSRFIKTQSPIKSTPPPPPEAAAASPPSVPFYTLPRKRRDGRSVPAVTSPPPEPNATTRTRSYSTATLDRQNKRSTVWYTFSETDIRLRNNGVSVCGSPPSV